MELELMATNTYLKALLGQAQNVRPSTSINIAKGIGNVGRFALKRHPIGFGMLTAASILGSRYFDEEEEGIEPTPAREDYLATLNNKFSDEELERFQTQMTQYDRGNHDKGNSSWYNLDYDSFN